MDVVNGHWDTLKRVHVEFPRGIGREEWKRFRREIRERAAMEWDVMLDLTRETWESEHERAQAGDEGSQEGDEESQEAEDWSQAEEEELQEEDGGW